MCLSGQDKVPSVHPQPQCLGDPIVSHIVSVFLSAGGSYEERVHPQGGPSINNTGLNVIIQSVKQMKLPPPDKFKLTGSLILNKSLLSGQLHLKQPIDSILHKQIFTNAVGLFKCFDFIDGWTNLHYLNQLINWGNLSKLTFTQGMLQSMINNASMWINVQESHNTDYICCVVQQWTALKVWTSSLAPQPVDHMPAEDVSRLLSAL